MLKGGKLPYRHQQSKTRRERENYERGGLSGNDKGMRQFCGLFFLSFFPVLFN
jgi:hypothetical protein